MAGADQAAVTLGNTNGAIGGLTISDPSVTSHWCLAHYIIDGHHKIFAASRSKRPVGLLSILALDRGVSSAQEHAKLIAAQKVEPDGPAIHALRGALVADGLIKGGV